MCLTGLTEEQCNELASPEEEEPPQGPAEDEDAWPELGVPAALETDDSSAAHPVSQPLAEVSLWPLRA